MHDAITDISGLEVGHWTDAAAATGCSVVICRKGAVGGVDVRGAAPGTRETDLLRPGNLVQEVHAVLLSGGSAFGLDAASGVMRYLEEQGVGFKVGAAVVPIVPGAILFDLGLVTHKIRPGAQEGYMACQRASTGVVEQGSVGAGTGATVGKALGREWATKGGIGSASIELDGGLVVGALVAVNALGDVVDPDTGRLLAGPRREGGGFTSTVSLLAEGVALRFAPPLTNTTIGIVATNATLSKEQACRLAQMAHDGMALAIRPCHTMMDGDTLFALATGEVKGKTDMNRLGVAAVRAVSKAIVKAITQATGLGGVPAAREWEAA